MSTEQATRLHYFENVHTLEEARDRYANFMGAISVSHCQRLEPISLAHEKTFLAETRGHGAINAVRAMATATGKVEHTLTQTKATVEAVSQEASVIIPSLLSPADRALFEAAKKSMNSGYWVGSLRVNRTLEAATSTLARHAMRVALDAGSIRLLHGASMTYGVGSATVRERLAGITPEAQAAAQASLDAKVWQEYLRDAKLYGAGSEAAEKTLENATTETVRFALICALDGERFRQMERTARLYGPKNEKIARLLSDTSSSAVEQVLLSRLNGTVVDGDEKKAKQRVAIAESSVEEEVQAIIAKVVKNDSGYRWLLREDVADVRRVINTVRQLRADAVAKEGSISDREIYLRYRRQIDKGEQDHKSTADPRLVKSYQILSALMGDNLNGKLPF